MAISDRVTGPRTRFAATALVLSVVAAGCTQIDNALAAVPIFSFLRDAPSFDPYEHPLPSPPGAVPFESPSGPALPPLAATEPALQAWAAGPYGVNPLQPDSATLATGRVMYDRYCAVCHGATGRGDGPLVGPGKFPAVPALVTPPATDRADGYVYAVIRAGRGLMPAYGARMTHDERWATVLYIHQLQAGAGVAPAAQPAQPPADTAAAPQ